MNGAGCFNSFLLYTFDEDIVYYILTKLGYKHSACGLRGSPTTTLLNQIAITRYLGMWRLLMTVQLGTTWVVKNAIDC